MGTEETPLPDSQDIPADQEKIVLEKRKLQLEINALNRFWLLKPEYLSVLSYVLVAAATVLILYFNGAFGVKSDIIKNENLLLEIRRDTLNKQISAYSSILDGLKSDSIKKVKMLFSYRDSIKTIQSKLHYTDSVLKIVQKSFSSQQEAVLNLINTKYELNNNIKLLNDSVTVVNSKYQFANQQLQSLYANPHSPTYQNLMARQDMERKEWQQEKAQLLVKVSRLQFSLDTCRASLQKR